MYILASDLVRRDIAVPNLMIISFCISESLKTAFKTGSSILIKHLNLCMQVVNSKCIFNIEKNGFK